MTARKEHRRDQHGLVRLLAEAEGYVLVDKGAAPFVLSRKDWEALPIEAPGRRRSDCPYDEGVSDMTDRVQNIETVARNICGRELAAAPRMTTAELPGLVDRFWPAIAAELMAGLRDEDGNIVPHSPAAAIEAWESWLDDHENSDFRL